MNIINKFLKYFIKKKTEIEYVEAALSRYKYKLEKLNYEFDPTKDCCQSCCYPEYDALCDKIDRVEHWLSILKKKKIE